MRWNWQQPDWPNFTWHQARLAAAETQYLLGGGVFAGIAGQVDAVDRQYLTVEALSTEAVTTSAIEGEILDRASVQSSIRRQLGYGSDNRRVGPAEQGIARIMVDLHQSFAAPLSDAQLFDWHGMLTGGRRDLNDIGRYRTHAEPMQIVSGALHAPKIHFEAPSSEAVPAEMARFLAWFNRTAFEPSSAMPVLTRAGIAHLWFESIHPFEDGNGRIGRAIAEKALSQGLMRPTLSALAATVSSKRKAYYAALEAASLGLDVTDWLCWFAAAAIEAQRRSVALVTFLIDKLRLLDRVDDELKPRQRKALLRVLQEGPDGFRGGLSAANYIAITGAARSTATRDLADLVAKGALVRTGERRHARYQVGIPLNPVAPVVIDEHGHVLPPQ